MPLTTACIGAHVTPAVISTLFAHYTDRKSRRHKPTAHVSYDQGLNVIRAFLQHAAYHTVEDLQHFTAQRVPTPGWVRVEEVTIPEEYLSQAAEKITEQLGPRGIMRVGGPTWWQWRGPMKDLKAEWIEMKSDYRARKRTNERCRRIMFYVHGGAYFFGSIDTHRYQLQRHARKLKARIFARCVSLRTVATYRLAPQFPFPCGLQDCIAAYLYLLSQHDPSEILMAGDSAGGGMVVSILVTLRDRGLPLPAGAILLSPWVDLTHSFPSVEAGSSLDYIPEHGFMHTPSGAWPPPNADDLMEIRKGAAQKKPGSQTSIGDVQPTRDTETAVHGFDVRKDSAPAVTAPGGRAYPGLRPDLKPVTAEQILTNEADQITVRMPDGSTITIKDQIQMYAPNQLLSHPLVSPILQPSLGGLPPLMITTGGGELLRDEQIYLAHKAANPSAYLPFDPYLDEHDPDRTIINKYEPTYVQLQVWDDLCHVVPTLSWTRPAKAMYRAIAQFGAWALSRAQKQAIEIPKNEPDSPSMSPNESGPSSPDTVEEAEKPGQVGKAGDPLPRFHQHMIRQRVDRHGAIFPLDPPESLPALQQPRDKIGAVNPMIVQKWLGAKKAWDERFAQEKLNVQRRRIEEFKRGYFGFDGEMPPVCALASRRREKDITPRVKEEKSYAMMLWSFMASKHDREMAEGQKNAEKEEEAARRRSSEKKKRRPSAASQRRTQSQTVSDMGQANGSDQAAAAEKESGPAQGQQSAQRADNPAPASPA